MTDQPEEVEELARSLEAGDLSADEYVKRLQSLVEEGSLSPDDYVQLKLELLEARRDEVLQAAPGWYEDAASDTGAQAYWDGQSWTGQTRPGRRDLTEAEIWFGYTGRIGVGAFWGRYVVAAIVVNASILVIAFGLGDSFVTTAATAAVGLFVFWPYSALMWKRLQDQNRKGVLFFIWFIPIIGQIAHLVLSLMPSSSGPNEFGPAPGARFAE